MKNVTLILIAAVFVAAAWFVASERRPEKEISRPTLLPELIDRVNDVARVELTSASGSTTLQRRDADWTVATSDGYPADFERVKQLVLTLAEMQIIEPKTRVAERYGRIGVKSVDFEDSRAVRVDLADADGTPLTSLLVGDAREGGGAPARYVRRPEAEQSYLVTARFDYHAEDRDWMDRSILDIQPERIQRVSIAPDEGPAYTLARDAEGQLALNDIPEGMRERSGATTSSIGSFLAGLRFDSVRAVERVDLPATPVLTAEYLTDAGGVVSVAAFEVDETMLFRFTAGFDPAQAVEADAASGTADGQANPEGAAAMMLGDDGDSGTALGSDEDAAALNASLGPWAFDLPEFKRSLVTRSRADLIQPEPERAEVEETP